MKNLYYARDKGTVNHNTVTRSLKKFRSGYRNLDDKARLDKPKTMDSEAVLQVIEPNPVSSTRRVSGELCISLFSVVHYIHDLGKSGE